MENKQVAFSEHVLPAQLDIRAVESFYEEIKKLSERTTHITLDASKVERLTTPCVQIILSLAKYLTASGGALKITSPTVVFSLAFTDLGFSRNLKEWSAA
ncbi:MAG: STAS domain-containing protein [Proteobacteria bacterium]|nr:STAS domain-containing protein [Pseudomonadota bacterium]